jgi:hypothetical protein
MATPGDSDWTAAEAGAASFQRDVDDFCYSLPTGMEHVSGRNQSLLSPTETFATPPRLTLDRHK